MNLISIAGFLRFGSVQSTVLAEGPETAFGRRLRRVRLGHGFFCFLCFCFVLFFLNQGSKR